jgi:hypothetical protein
MASIRRRGFRDDWQGLDRHSDTGALVDGLRRAGSVSRRERFDRFRVEPTASSKRGKR